MNNLNSLQVVDFKKKPFKYITILIVDEDFSFLSSIQSMLEKEGYLTIGFTRGDAAIKSINKHRPDLILLNYSIDNKSVMNLINALIENKVNLPFIVMTNDLDDNFANEISKLGIEKVLLKNEKFIELLLSNIAAILK